MSDEFWMWALGLGLFLWTAIASYRAGKQAGEAAERSRWAARPTAERIDRQQAAFDEMVEADPVLRKIRDDAEAEFRTRHRRS